MAAETLGIAAAILSSALGGTAVATTRRLAGVLDPATLGALRFGIGFLLLVPIALLGGGRWPPRRDWPRVAMLGMLFFALFPWLFNAALAMTTAARGALALSTMPLLTMAVGAALGVERLTVRKTVGVLLATAGVAAALAAGLADAPDGAWRGDLTMVAAALCMALYNVLSRPVIARSGPVPFTAAAMGAGAVCVTLAAWWQGGLGALARVTPGEWIGVGYLGGVCAALVFWLWAFALARTTPTRVAVSVAVNPVTAALLAVVLLGEPIRAELIVGVVAVIAGIRIAVTARAPGR